MIFNPPSLSLAYSLFSFCLMRSKSNFLQYELLEIRISITQHCLFATGHVTAAHTAVELVCSTCFRSSVETGWRTKQGEARNHRSCARWRHGLQLCVSVVHYFPFFPGVLLSSGALPSLSLAQVLHVLCLTSSSMHVQETVPQTVYRRRLETDLF